MSIIKLMFNNIIDSLIYNFFFYKYKNTFKLKGNYQNSNKLNCLIELQFHNFFLIIIYLFFAQQIAKKYNIFFFYYSRKDKILNLHLFKFLFYNIFKTIKKKLNSNIINFYEKPKSHSIEIALKIFKRLKKKNDVNKISYKGLIIGKYIYQSYCRELLEKTIDIKDKRLIKFISEAITVVDTVKKFTEEKKIKKLFISHTIFIRYGIISKIVSNQNGDVCILYPVSKNGYLKDLTLLKTSKELIQQEKYWIFKKNFSKLKNKKYLLQKSKIDLEQRIYKNQKSLKLMTKNTPYDNKKILDLKNTEKKIKVIILPSCFFDAVGFFRYSLFPDSYSWVTHLLEIAKKTNHDWYIKSHPDGMIENERVIKELKKKYPFLNILQSDTSNLTFKKNNFTTMFTYQGSACHEFEFMDIPSVITSDNVQVNYSFGKVTKTIKKFNNLIRNPNQIKSIKNKNKVYEFNYMFSFDKSPDLIKVNFFNKKISKVIEKYHITQTINQGVSKKFTYKLKKISVFMKNLNQKNVNSIYNLAKKI